MSTSERRGGRLVDMGRQKVMRDGGINVFSVMFTTLQGIPTVRHIMYKDGIKSKR